jgi:flagellar assembly factor FliW
MKLRTKFEEIIEINKSDILSFEHGLPGFEDEKQFVLIPLDGTPFSILQSVHNSTLAFITSNPFVFFKGYEFELPESVQEQLEIKKFEDVSVQAIITLAEKFEKSTANLQAPIVINKKRNIGKQVVLNHPAYQTRHLLSESSVIGKEG